MPRRMRCLLMIFTALAAATAPARAQRIYWTGSGGVRRANLDGSNAELVVPNGGGIALDLVDGKLYFVVGSPLRIQRANLDGSEMEDVVTSGLSAPWTIALDHLRRKIYWIDAVGVFRADMDDGANVESVILGSEFAFHGIAIDATEAKLYWTISDTSFQGILRGPLDGSSSEPLITEGLLNPYGLALDPVGEKFYWADMALGRISRANLDGSDGEPIVDNLYSPVNVSVDPVKGKVYWTDGRLMYRVNLDGSDREVVLPQPHGPWDLAIDYRVTSDCDSNGEVRLPDHQAFVDCMTGPTVNAPTECLCADTNGDRDVDLADFAALQRAFGAN